MVFKYYYWLKITESSLLKTIQRRRGIRDSAPGSDYIICDPEIFRIFDLFLIVTHIVTGCHAILRGQSLPSTSPLHILLSSATFVPLYKPGIRKGKREWLATNSIRSCRTGSEES
jgi:hypothetical protein